MVIIKLCGKKGLHHFKLSGRKFLKSSNPAFSFSKFSLYLSILRLNYFLALSIKVSLALGYRLSSSGIDGLSFMIEFISRVSVSLICFMALSKMGIIDGSSLDSLKYFYKSFLLAPNRSLRRWLPTSAWTHCNSLSPYFFWSSGKMLFTHPISTSINYQVPTPK